MQLGTSSSVSLHPATRYLLDEAESHFRHVMPLIILILILYLHMKQRRSFRTTAGWTVSVYQACGSEEGEWDA